jgi:hypothetical protein
MHQGFGRLRPKPRSSVVLSRSSAAEIVEELEAALAQFTELAASLPVDSAPAPPESV